MHRTMYVFLLIAGLLAVGTGMWLFAQQNGQPSLLRSEQAIERAQRFLSICELPAPKSAPRVLWRELYGKQIWHLSWPNLYTVEVDARTGVVIGFKNYGREYEQVKGINRNRQSRFATRQEMEQYVWQMARRLGLPKDATLKRLTIYEEGAFIGDANRAGGIFASFDVRPFGYPILGEGGVFGISVDILDGVLVGMTRALETIVESHTVSFPKDKAVAKAKQVYAEYYRTRTSPHRGTYKGKVELGYVLPNGMFGGKRYPEQVPFRLRLAWAVYFGEEAVWIDAGDGSILGGEILK
ncbi:MAG: hypothetical protein ACUVR7_13295 [Armatimonadota bacterium]